MVLRPDYYFRTPLKINEYFDFYNTGRWKGFCGGIPKKCIFAAHNSFTFLLVSDPRHIGDADLLWFGNFAPMPVPYNVIELSKDDIYVILIKYSLHIDIFLHRGDHIQCLDLGWMWNESDEFRKTREKLKAIDEYKITSFGGFMKFYTRKRLKSFKNSLAKLRRKTRAIRYPIKRFFGFKTLDNKETK